MFSLKYFSAFCLVILVPEVFTQTSDSKQESPSSATQYQPPPSHRPPPSSNGASVASSKTRPISNYYLSSSGGVNYRQEPPPPPEYPVYHSYAPGPPPSRPHTSWSGLSGYRPGRGTSHDPHHDYHPEFDPPIVPSGSLGYRPSLSPYHQSYIPAIYHYPPQSSPTGWRPGKPPLSIDPPPPHSHPPHHHHHHHHSHHNHHHGPPHSGWPSIVSAEASASAEFGSVAAAAAAASYPVDDDFGWGPPRPPPTGPPPPSIEPETEDVFGWGPPPPRPRPPYKPVPEFSYQFSLKPSSFGWETSYNVPCGNYKIQPRVMAHLRLATQAVLPRNSGEAHEIPSSSESRRRKRQGLDHGLPSAKSFIDPFRLERQLQSYNPYSSQAFTQPRPTFRPRTCRWNFNAVDDCKLNFKCSWFQLPALFRCDENYLRVTDNTILLDKTFCGNRRPRSDQIFSSSSGKLMLTFKSKGAALPAILDCTVLCTPTEGDDLAQLKPSPTPTEFGSTFDPASLPGGDPTVFPSYPIILNQLLVSAASQNKDLRKNTTLQVQQRSPSKPQLRTGNCRCGVPDSYFSSKVVHGRIVGGSSMIPGESPWTAALVKWNSNRPYCGASLINNRFLLTAAHCVLNQARKTRGSNNGTYSREQIYFDVLLNEHDISQPNEIAGGTIRAKVDRVIVHPNYDNVTFNFDAALIRLAEPIEFNIWREPKSPLLQIYQNLNSNSSSASRSSSVSAGKNDGKKNSTKNGSSNVHRLFYNTFDFHSLKKKRSLIPEIEARAIPPKPVPICLPEAAGESSQERFGRTTKDDEDNFAVVTGWGLVTEGGTPSTEMLKARVQIFNDSTCQELYKKHNYVITDTMMCAGYINGKIDSCVGDSGSPLATEDKDRFVLTGVVSWGRGCGRKQLPGVYTKVTELMDWVYKEASTNDAVWCE